MKKATAVILVLIMLLSLFACGKETPADTPSQDPSAGSQSPASSSPSAPVESSDSPEPANPDADKYGGVLKVVLQAEGAAPIGLPWGNVSVDGLLQRTFMEALFYQTSVTGDIIPNIATGWELDEANSELIVSLTPGVMFHDGTELTAEVAGWNLMMGVEARTVNVHIIGYEARDDHTLALKFDTWTHEILASLSTALMCSKDAYEKNGEEWIKENPVGTGPFIMSEYIRGQMLKGERNPNYWQDGKPYLDGIEYHFIRDQMTQAMAIQAEGADGIDVLNTNTAELAVQLMQLDLQHFTINAGPTTLFPSSNNPDSPLSKLEVRQAVSYAIDREAIVAARGYGLYAPAYQFAGEGNTAHLPDSYNVSYNLEKAKELMVQAGYPDGFTTKLITQPGSTDREVAVAIQLMLAELGIVAELEYPDSGGYASLRSGGWEGFLVQATRLMPRITGSYYAYFDDAGLFMTSVERPEGWNEALAYSRQTRDIEPAAVQECHKIMMDNLMLIPVMDVVGNFFVKPNVHDTHLFEDERMSFVDAWIEK